jgi:hypothetical protein
MTTKELVDRVETNLRMLVIKDVPGDADILVYLNEENVRICRDLRVPRRYIKDVDPTQPFAMPTEALPGSLSFSEKAVHEQRVHVLTVDEANAYFPDWERNEHEGYTRYPHRLVIYDPGNITAPVYPIGFQPGDLLRLTYVVKPRPLVFDDPDADASVALVAMEGVIPEYHRLLYQMTTFQLAMMLGDEIQAGKARAFYGDAMNELRDAFSYSRPDYQLPVAPWAGRA